MSKGKKKKSRINEPNTVRSAKTAKASVLPAWLWWMIGFAAVSALLTSLLPVYLPSINRLSNQENPLTLAAMWPLYVGNICMPLLTCGAFVFYALEKKIPSYICALLNMVFPALCSMTGCYGLAEIVLYGGCAMLLGGFITLHRRESNGKVMQYILLTLGGVGLVLHFVMAVAYGATGIIYATADVKGAYAVITAYYMAPALYFLLHAIGAWKNIPHPQSDAFTRRTLPHQR